MSPSVRTTKPKASEIAAETKKVYIPWVERQFPKWTPWSVLYTLQNLTPPPALNGPPHVPEFEVLVGDPVDNAIAWARQIFADLDDPSTKAFLICAANERRAGGDWETGVVGYEERLCRRSNLSATLTAPQPGGPSSTHYPIPITAGILSPHVTVFRGPHDRYDPWPIAISLPIISVPPARWPKLTSNGTRYSFNEERAVVVDKIRVALKIAIQAGGRHIVVGDFGLGNGYRNPPMEMAAIWREVLFYDPDIRGRILGVKFVFEDPAQSTTRCIAQEIAKDIAKRESSKTKSSGRPLPGSLGPHLGRAGHEWTDFAIFQHMFDPVEIHRMLAATDPRHGITHLTS